MEPFSQSPPLFETRIRGLEKIHQGKVRDIYAVDADHWLIVTTDRLSAFDVVLPDPIPFKGEVLTRISSFWFGKTRHIVPNHMTGFAMEDVVSDREERAQLAGRSMVVQKLRALPIEAVVRGYLSGSGYKDYRSRGSVCGIALPDGLRMADALPAPIFTPASKAPAGQHDENIDFETIVGLVGRELAAEIRRIALAVYALAAEHARLLALLAGRLIPTGLQPSELRQTVRARLSRVPALEQAAAGAAVAARNHRAHERQLSQGAHSADGLMRKPGSNEPRGRDAPTGR
jgi:phosphoribosylaminoimidazole-succinocarboxamide synthase